MPSKTSRIRRLVLIALVCASALPLRTLSAQTVPEIATPPLQQRLENVKELLELIFGPQGDKQGSSDYIVGLPGRWAAIVPDNSIPTPEFEMRLREICSQASTTIKLANKLGLPIFSIDLRLEKRRERYEARYLGKRSFQFIEEISDVTGRRGKSSRIELRDGKAANIKSYLEFSNQSIKRLSISIRSNELVIISNEAVQKNDIYLFRCSPDVKGSSSRKLKTSIGLAQAINLKRNEQNGGVSFAKNSDISAIKQLIGKWSEYYPYMGKTDLTILELCSKNTFELNQPNDDMLELEATSGDQHKFLFSIKYDPRGYFVKRKSDDDIKNLTNYLRLKYPQERGYNNRYTDSYFLFEYENEISMTEVKFLTVDVDHNTIVPVYSSRNDFVDSGYLSNQMPVWFRCP